MNTKELEILFFEHYSDFQLTIYPSPLTNTTQFCILDKKCKNQLVKEVSIHVGTKNLTKLKSDKARFNQLQSKFEMMIDMLDSTVLD